MTGLAVGSCIPAGWRRTAGRTTVGSVGRIAAAAGSSVRAGRPGGSCTTGVAVAAVVGLLGQEWVRVLERGQAGGAEPRASTVEARHMMD